MNVSVSLDNGNITAVEERIANVLCTCLQEDIGKIECPNCQADSQVILHVNTSKMSVLRTEIKACCPQFSIMIEEKMAVEA